ncbi:hypothetical protein HHI36_002335 [Cryptolaemus montrouzieri]|uniref:Uncharacterized protein n=1 Tax=Cryptolaemus montrouzieri TaxID=559131 RepID=A0ABD2PB03_9CUCU
MFSPFNYISISRTKYKDPPNLETNAKYLAESGKISIYELLKEIDVHHKMGDGFPYKSYSRLTATKFKHIRKSVGPTDYFRHPVTTAMEIGFWSADPVLKEEWYKPRITYRHSKCPIITYYEKALMTDKFFKLRSY